jgi:hypothetical protein
MQRRAPLPNNEAGFVLPMVILALAIMSILILTTLSSSADERLGSRSDVEGTRSFYAAEAGVNTVIATWDSLHYDTLAAVPGASADLGWQTVPENRARYHAVIQRISSSTKLLTVEGQSASAGQGLRLISVLLLDSGRFNYAAFGNTQSTLSSSGSDSYNSSSGPYAVGTAHANGDVGSNGNVSTSGSTVIHGDASAGGTVSNPGAVTGSSTSGAAPLSLPTVACPVGGYTPSVPAGAGITYNAVTGALSVSGGHNLTLPVPPTSYYFGSVTLSGSSTLGFSSSTTHVDLYIGGALTVSGGGIMNTAALPTMLTIWGCGSNTSNWTISGGSSAYYAVWAPTHPLTLSGGSGFFGSFYGSAVTVSGGSQLHYDEALGGGTGAGLITGSWTELSR